MSFDEDLRAYLERVSKNTVVDESVPRRHIDESELRAHLLMRLRENRHEFDAGSVDFMFDVWSYRLSELARFIEKLPSAIAPTDDVGADRFGKRVLDAGLRMLDPTESHVDARELRRLVDDFDRSDGGIGEYATELQFVHRDAANTVRVTDLGNVLLRLRGKDAVRWLLTAEVVQHYRDFDPWRVPRALLKECLKGAALGYVRSSIIRRLRDLGVLVPEPQTDPKLHRYVVAEPLRGVVEAVVAPSSWDTVIIAMLEDARQGALPAIATSASEATIEQMRLTVHEVRNALVPARLQLDALLRTPNSSDELGHQERMKSVRRGVIRVLEYVQDMEATKEMVTEPATANDATALIRESLGRLEGGDRVAVAENAAIWIRVPRLRFVGAVTNVIRNALQATAAPQIVMVSLNRDADVVQIAVEDPGPGIPVELREQVFHDGFTTRHGEGSGFGLAYVRKVMTDIPRGKVWCEAGELGGAKFVIELPVDSPR